MSYFVTFIRPPTFLEQKANDLGPYYILMSSSDTGKCFNNTEAYIKQAKKCTSHNFED